MQNSEPPSAKAASSGARARGRPRAFDRERALAEATRLFWSKGYEATSISDLTSAMGIGSPSLYAAFGSKEALYAEALRHYVETYEALVWGEFRCARTARDAVHRYLLNSASALTGCAPDRPLGCMVTLSAVGSEGHAELGRLVRSFRAESLERLEARLEEGIAHGEMSGTTDGHMLARFVQTVQSGMSVLARDGASCAELEAVADIAMLGWDAYAGGPR